MFREGVFIGAHLTLEAALEVGYALYGLEVDGYSFTVKQVEPMREWEKKLWKDREAGEAEYASWLVLLNKKD